MNIELYYTCDPIWSSHFGCLGVMKIEPIKEGNTEICKVIDDLFYL